MGSRRSSLASVLVLLVAACTSSPAPQPSPSPTAPVATSPGPTEPVGLRVAVVLPPTGEAPLTTTGTRVAADAVASRHGNGLGEFRTVAPDPGAFVGDVATVLAERGYDLVCVVGRQAAEVVLDIAPTFPATRFCGVPAPDGVDGQQVPDNALLIDVRLEEAAYLAGVAAGHVPPRASPPAEEDDGPAPRPAGLVGDRTRPLTAHQRIAFVAGLGAVLGGQVSAQVDLDATTEEELTARAVAQFGAGVPVVFLPGGQPDGGVLEAAAAEDALVIVLRDRARFDGDTPETVLMWFLVDVGVALDLAVKRAIGGWEGGTASVGLAEDAIRPQAGAAESSTTTFARVREAGAALRDGSRSVPGP